MKNLKDTLLEVGFSNELIDAISATPQMEEQEIEVDDTYYQTFENEIISSTEININGFSNKIKYYGAENK